MQVDGQELSADELQWVKESIRLKRREVEQVVNVRFNRYAKLHHERSGWPLSATFQEFRESAVPGDSPVNPHLCLGKILHGDQKGTQCTQRPVDGLHGFCARHVKQHPRWNPALGCVQLPQPPAQDVQPLSLIHI